MKTEEWQLQPVCKKCEYRRAIYGGHDRREASYWDFTACHYAFDTGNLRDGEPEGDYCPNFKKRKRNKK